MPLYEFRCTECSLKATIILHVDARNDPQTCVCGAPLKRLISAHAKHSSWAAHTIEDIRPVIHQTVDD